MHIVIHTEDDQTTDVSTYCTDTCARTDPDYAGWHGAQEPGPHDVCESCGTPLGELARPPRVPRRVYAPRDVMATLIDSNIRRAYAAARADTSVYHAGVAWYRDARSAIHAALCEIIARARSATGTAMELWDEYHREDDEDTAYARALFVYHVRRTNQTIPESRERRIMADLLGRCSKATPWIRQEVNLIRAAELALILSTVHTHHVKLGPVLPERYRTLSLYPATVAAIWNDAHTSRTYELLSPGSGKIYQFSRALDGDDRAIPVDRHMARAAGARDPRAVRHVIAKYTETIQATVRDVAEDYESTPATVQAIVWEWQRANPVPPLTPMALVGMSRR